MNVDEAKQRLKAAGLEITGEKRLGNDLGTQLHTNSGGIVNIFDKGTFNIQGKNTDNIKAALTDETASAAVAAATRPASLNRVFVVYGHDTTARGHLEAMLRRWGLEPLILDQLPSEGQTVIEKLESYTSDVGFAVVLATPDDEGYRVGHQDEKAYRARQNVVLELGMLLSLLGRKRVAILLKQQENMERPSDIQGLIYIPFKDDLQKEVSVLLAKEMNIQGYEIDIADL
jgi:predicted nucleotide-binding protein